MLKKSIIIIVVASIFNFFIVACCEDVMRVTSDYTISFLDYSDGSGYIPSTDTIKGAFIYSLDAVIVASLINAADFGLINKSYAYQCTKVYENGYRHETASVVLNKPFLLDGAEVEPGTNLLDIDKDRNGNEYDTRTEEYNAQVYPYGIRIWFKDEFISRITFPEDTYTFKSTVEMDDGTIIQSEESIFISIE